MNDDQLMRQETLKVVNAVELLTSEDECVRCSCGAYTPSYIADENGYITCSECGNTFELTEYNVVSLYDYISDNYGIDITMDLNDYVRGSRELRGANIMIAFGGPNIYINTISCAVRCYWGCGSYEEPISEEAAERIDNVVCDMMY